MVQEFTSLTITVCVPAVKPEVVEVVLKAPPSNEKLYVGVPPVTPVTVAVPLALPQLALVEATVKLEGPFAVPIINVVLKVQPFASFTNTVCVPAANPEVKLAVATPSTL